MAIEDLKSRVEAAVIELVAPHYHPPPRGLPAGFAQRIRALAKLPFHNTSDPGTRTILLFCGPMQCSATSALIVLHISPCCFKSDMCTEEAVLFVSSPQQCCFHPSCELPSLCALCQIETFTVILCCSPRHHLQVQRLSGF